MTIFENRCIATLLILAFAFTCCYGFYEADQCNQHADRCDASPRSLAGVNYPLLDNLIEKRKLAARGKRQNGGIFRTSYVKPDIRWENSTVPYYIDPTNYSEEDVAFIEKSLNQIARFTSGCIRFVRLAAKPNKETDYVLVRYHEYECTSVVGRNYGEQVATLSKDCIDEGDIQFVFFMILGMYPEHVRMDRDDYIDVLYQNIQQSKCKLFEKCDYCTYPPLPYDINSLMHFGSLIGSCGFTDGILIKPTMINKRTGKPIKMPYKPTRLDVDKLMLTYECKTTPDYSVIEEIRDRSTHERCLRMVHRYGCKGENTNGEWVLNNCNSYCNYIVEPW